MDGREIRWRRNAQGMSQGELAEKLGVSQRTVGNWERGATVPRSRAPQLQVLLGSQTENPSITEVSDAALLAEIARRFERAQEITRLRNMAAHMGAPAVTARLFELAHDDELTRIREAQTAPQDERAQAARAGTPEALPVTDVDPDPEGPEFGA